MLRTKFILNFLIVFYFQAVVEIKAQNRQIQISNEEQIVPGTIMVKLKSDESLLPSVNKQLLRVNDILKMSSVAKNQALSYGSINAKARSLNSKFLSNIYKITLNEDESLSKMINELLTYDNVVYAEPLYYEQLLFEPNDAQLTSQDHLEVIKAYDAWDITLGNSDIVVGIIDTGMQPDHEDLQNQVYTNDAEIANGIDDDGNGLVDDIVGWDFADDDNDPTADGSIHGTRVAGVSGAHTNNAIGVAGVGYLSKIVPLKIFTTSSNRSSNSYEAIIYAADQGYDVINLSWGSAGRYSQFNQDVINYAAKEKDVVIVAAAGNTNADLDFYPASYDNVLSVGASDVNDNKAGYATYSYNIDLMAPGVSVFTTSNDNLYAVATGSSFSAPQVAGAAALVRDVFPEFSALQVMQQLRVTADDIYEIGNNADYVGRLGKGRLNVLRALTETTSPSIRLDNLTYSGQFGDQVFFDDTVTVNMDYTNYLRVATNAMVSISTDSPYATFFSESDFSLGTLAILESIENFEIKFYIESTTPPGERIIFRLDFTDDSGYSDFEYFVVQLEQDYLTVDNGKLNFTVASNGSLGYAEDNFEGGEGFGLEGLILGDYFGIIVANHKDSVSNNVVNDYSSDVRDKSFQNNTSLKLIDHEGADYYSKSDFEDINEEEFALGIHIEQELLAWNDVENQDYLILEYRLSNNTLTPKENLLFGFYADWDLLDNYQNKANWDETNKLAYVYDGVGNQQYAGVAILTSQTGSHHGLDIESENGNVSEIDEEFLKSEKYDFMTTPKLTAGDEGAGNNVANLLTANIATLQAGMSQKVAFVMTVGSSLVELQEQVIKAQEKYDQFLLTPPITRSDTACFNEDFRLSINSGTTFEVFDDSQMSNLLFSGNDLDLGLFEKDTTIYYRNIDGNFASDISGLKLYVSKPTPNFEMSSDTLYLGDVALNQVQFTDNSGDAVSWQWNFDNGGMASLQNPKIAFPETGTYEIELIITTSLGCTGVITKQLLVALRSARPTINDQTICKSEPAVISSIDATNMKFYLNESAKAPIFEGNEFVTGNLDHDTIFYVSSVDDVFESHRVPVEIKIDQINADFLVRLDSLDLTQKNLLLLENKSLNAVSSEWLINDVVVGMEENASFAFDDESNLNVRINVLSELNCSDSKIQVFDLVVSPKPQIPDTIFICKYETATVSAESGDLLYIYDDRNQSNLLNKGTSILSGILIQDSMIYYTGVREFRESELDSVLLYVIPFETEISASPKTLILKNNRNVTFTSNNTDAISWRWFLQNELIETVASPILKFDTAGIYNMKLVVENSVGCLDTAYLNYEVKLITGLDEKLSNDILIYPNPVDSHFAIEHVSGKNIKDLKIFNTLGEEIDLIRMKKSDYFNASNLKNGIYFIIGMVDNINFSKRIVIRK